MCGKFHLAGCGFKAQGKKMQEIMGLVLVQEHRGIYFFFLTWSGQAVKCVKKWFEPRISVVLPDVFYHIFRTEFVS